MFTYDEWGGFFDHVSPPVRELEHCSVLRMIERRWNLQPLTVRDVNANNLALVLDFSIQRLNRPRLSVPQGPFGGACPGIPGGGDTWDILRQIATILGWPF